MSKVASEEFDYIVVGAGSAGCVLANRLSAQAGCSVLLVEAGPVDRSPWIHIPGGIYRLIHNPRYDWCYQTEPEAALSGRQMDWPRGKVLGGSSSINGLVYIRGQRQDFDLWSRLGCEGWSYREVLPYFIRAENQARGADDFHGTGGPLTVSDAGIRMELVDAFIDATAAAGFPKNRDFNGARQEGVGYFQFTIDHGRRCSTARGYLGALRHRPSVSIVTGALACRVIVQDGVARGVEYRVRGQRHEVSCRREVILSAGAIGSPQLLMLSGIGDPGELKRLGIDVVSPLPGVGRNLQDHLQVKTVFRTKRPVTVNDQVRSTLGKARVGAAYLFGRKGVLGFGASLAGAFLKSAPELDRPDIQFHFQPLSLDRYDAGLHRFSAFTMSPCCLQPASRGEIRLRSADPADKPLIYANYLSDARDRTTLIEGIRLARTIAAANPLAGLIEAEHLPGLDVKSRADVLEYVRRLGSTVFHPVGSCRMGVGEDSVVDPELRVRGVRGLRVADASVMPLIVSGNTNAAAIMIAEKAADLILNAQ